MTSSFSKIIVITQSLDLNRPMNPKSTCYNPFTQTHTQHESQTSHSHVIERERERPDYGNVNFTASGNARGEKEKKDVNA